MFFVGAIIVGRYDVSPHKAIYFFWPLCEVCQHGEKVTRNKNRNVESSWAMGCRPALTLQSPKSDLPQSEREGEKESS